MANDSLKPRNLRRHLVAKHPSIAEKPVEYFERKSMELQKQVALMNKITTTSTKALRASFEVSYLIAIDKKPHKIAETLVLPAAMKMCEIINGEKFSEAMKSIPLSTRKGPIRIVLLRLHSIIIL